MVELRGMGNGTATLSVRVDHKPQGERRGSILISKFGKEIVLTKNSSNKQRHFKPTSQIKTT